MTVLVTGAAGFIGKHLVRSLLDDGYDVVGVDTFITSDEADLALLLREPNFRFEQMDVASLEFPQFAAELDLEAIYNLACPTGVPNLRPMALEMLEASYEGSKHVLELAATHRVPALLTSTAEVYGNPTQVPQPESYTGNVDTLGPRKGYEEGKRVAETLFGVYADRFGVNAKIARVFNTYGPGMSLRDTRVTPAFVRAAIEGLPLTMHGDGGQTRCHCYVSDMVAGIRAVMGRGIAGRAYNLGSQTQTTVRELAERITFLAGSESRIESVPRPAHDHDNRLPDTSRARKELGWTPTVGQDEGLAAMIMDFRARLIHGGLVSHAA